MPAVVLSLTHEEAAVALVDSNLHREHLLPSEKAFAYKLKSEATKHQGKKKEASENLWDASFIDPSMGHNVPKSDENRTTAEIGEQTGESYKTIQRYIRLTFLVPELLKFVDERKVAMTPAVYLSYLSVQEQECRNGVAQMDYTIIYLKNFLTGLCLSPPRFFAVVCGENYSRFSFRLRISSVSAQ